MSKFAGVIFFFFVGVSPLNAQKGSAPNGYYPANYAGSIFTGTLESLDADSREMILVYAKGATQERFVGRLESICSWKGKNGVEHSAAAISKGAVLTAYYTGVTKKADGQKTTENSIFAISYAEINGKKIPDDKRLMISCSEGGSRYFRAFR